MWKTHTHTNPSLPFQDFNAQPSILNCFRENMIIQNNQSCHLQCWNSKRSYFPKYQKSSKMCYLSCVCVYVRTRSVFFKQSTQCYLVLVHPQLCLLLLSLKVLFASQLSSEAERNQISASGKQLLLTVTYQLAILTSPTFAVAATSPASEKHA